MTKYIRFRREGEVRYGTLEGDRVRILKLDPFQDPGALTSEIPLDTIQMMAPCDPSKIVCVGLNYRDHAKEVGQAIPEEPLIFLKPPTAVIGPDERIIMPPMSARVDYEGELAIVIKKRAKNVPLEEAEGYILGYTCFNDVTARDLVAKDGGPLRAKIFDTFAAFGPCIAAGIDPSRLAIRTYLNGVVKQSSNTAHLIFSPSFLVSFISQVLTLMPGDIISTGTPAGIEAMKAGDVVEVEIEDIGRLRNRVALPQGKGDR